MVNRRRAAITTFAGSTATTLLVSIQALVLMPMYLTHIGSRMYGAWLATGDLLVLMLAFDMGIPNILIQRIGAALAKSDKRAIGAYFGTGATVLVSFTLVLGAILASLSPFVPGWVHLAGAEADLLHKAFLLDTIAICMMLVNFIFQGLARGLQETTAVNISSFTATFIGFCTTLGLLLTGHGLWSISIGVAVRGFITLLGSILFLRFGVDVEIRKALRFDREVAKEFWQLSPMMFLSGFAYSLMNNSQTFLAAVVLGPESATILGLTRKAADLGRNVLDAVGNASYGGFAHLVATGDKVKGRSVYREVISVYLTVGLAIMCAYVAVNRSLIGVWIPKGQFGGTLLTVLLALSTLIGGWSYLTLSLYRSTGHHRQVSLALLIECLVRLPAMLTFLYLFGLPGLPFGAIITGLISGLWANQKTNAQLESGYSQDEHPLRVWAIRGIAFASGIILCSLVFRPSWSFVLSVGPTVLVTVGSLLLLTDPMLHRMKSMLQRKVARTI